MFAELQNKRSERKRRSTANPQFSYNHFEPEVRVCGVLELLLLFTPYSSSYTFLFLLCVVFWWCFVCLICAWCMLVTDFVTFMFHWWFLLTEVQTFWVWTTKKHTCNVIIFYQFCINSRRFGRNVVISYFITGSLQFCRGCELFYFLVTITQGQVPVTNWL